MKNLFLKISSVGQCRGAGPFLPDSGALKFLHIQSNHYIEPQSLVVFGTEAWWGNCAYTNTHDREERWDNFLFV